MASVVLMLPRNGKFIMGQSQYNYHYYISSTSHSLFSILGSIFWHTIMQAQEIANNNTQQRALKRGDDGFPTRTPVEIESCLHIRILKKLRVASKYKLIQNFKCHHPKFLPLIKDKQRTLIEAHTKKIII